MLCQHCQCANFMLQAIVIASASLSKHCKATLLWSKSFSWKARNIILSSHLWWWEAMKVYKWTGAKLYPYVAIAGALGDKPDGFTFNLQEVTDIASQVLQALACMHKKRIVHADLKPDNVLFLSDQEVVICDFGLAIELGPEAKQLNSYRGTWVYMAYELFAQHKIDTPVSVWLLCVWWPFCLLLSAENNCAWQLQRSTVLTARILKAIVIAFYALLETHRAYISIASWIPVQQGALWSHCKGWMNVPSWK